MNINSQTIELIDQYLKGHLSIAEKEAFEKRMGEDDSLADEVAIQKVVSELVLEKGLMDIRVKVAQDLSTSSSPSSWRKTGLIVLLSLLSTAGIMYFYSVKSNHKKPTERILRDYKTQSPTSEIPDKKQELKKSEKLQSKKQPESIKTPPSIELNKSENQITKEVKTDTIIQVDTTTISEIVSEPKKIIENEEKVLETVCPEIEFDVKSEASCRNQQTGSIQILISTINGGQIPYSYSIAGNPFSLESMNNKLATGNYTVEIKDKNRCLSGQQVFVPEKRCEEYKDYSFNPETEFLKLPFTANESGTIAIMDQAGKRVFDTRIINGDPHEWNGRGMNGETLPTGTYLYIAETEQGDIRKGYIIILH